MHQKISRSKRLHLRKKFGLTGVSDVLLAPPTDYDIVHFLRFPLPGEMRTLYMVLVPAPGAFPGIRSSMIPATMMHIMMTAMIASRVLSRCLICTGWWI